MNGLMDSPRMQCKELIVKHIETAKLRTNREYNMDSEAVHCSLMFTFIMFSMFSYLAAFLSKNWTFFKLTFLLDWPYSCACSCCFFGIPLLMISPAKRSLFRKPSRRYTDQNKGHTNHRMVKTYVNIVVNMRNVEKQSSKITPIGLVFVHPFPNDPFKKEIWFVPHHWCWWCEKIMDSHFNDVWDHGDIPTAIIYIYLYII